MREVYVGKRSGGDLFLVPSPFKEMLENGVALESREANKT